MNFLITFYIYPLVKPIIVSDFLGFSLDNPRDSDEVSFVKRFLLDAYEGGGLKFPIDSDEDIVTLESILERFFNNFSVVDDYVKETFSTYDREQIFDFIAKIWVIARYGYEDQYEAPILSQMRVDELDNIGILILEDDHPTVRNSNKLLDYSYLLSLLIHTAGTDYFGESFIVDYSEFRKTIIRDPWFHFFTYGGASTHFKEGGLKLQEGFRWSFLPGIQNDLVSTAQLLDQVLEEGSTEKLLYVANILRIVGYEVNDVKVRLLMLTSIIELLLTHSPNFNRYNVEDSINKQFQLKASILIYQNDRNRDINAVQQRLKTIYQMRSNIAHGNFNEIAKYVKNLTKKQNQQEYLDDLVVDLYVYVRAIIEEFLKDHTFVEFLKKT